jgi:branched-chain amino acid transport system ATP-binding protein
MTQPQAPTVTTIKGDGRAGGVRPVLELQGLTAGYGELAAVKDVSISLVPGEITAIFGANGAGKTTLLLATVGLLPLMSGRVIWDGSSTRGEPLQRLARRRLCFVPGAPSVVRGLSVRENLQLGRGGVAGAVTVFPELGALLKRPAGLLSGGEQQILSLGRAIASEPKALLVDELSLGLAPLVADRLLVTLRQAATDLGMAVLLVEQQTRRALSIADDWHLLANGRVTASGPADHSAELERAYLASMRSTPVE